MGTYAYEAVNGAGFTIKGAMDVESQSEALSRIKEMGLFPTKVRENRPKRLISTTTKPTGLNRLKNVSITIPFISGRVKRSVLSAFTRQLATVIEAGMPLLRGLRLLQEQETDPKLKSIIGELSVSIESGNNLSDGLARHPKVFDPLYVNMVRAGEIGGLLDITLRRLSEFLDKAQKIKGRVMAAMFYPVAVIVAATGIMALMLLYVVPKFRAVFDGLLNGKTMPRFTLFVLKVSEVVQHNFLMLTGVGVALALVFSAIIRTRTGRSLYDRLKLRVPIFGLIFKKAAISRFTRTLGTLLNSGVPILQALEIVRQTAGNVAVQKVILSVHDSVKEGDTLASPLKGSGIFPPLVAGMVDVGEQTGALPSMLLKIADNYDEEVDNSVNAMTSLLEPIMIIFLGVMVGSIVIAMFLPILTIINQPEPGGDIAAE